MPETTTAGVLLIAMPWHWVAMPSLQLGLLQSVLDKSGIRTDVRTLAIDYLDHCCAETAGLPAAERIDADDYESIVSDYGRLGIPDWIFAVPPFRDDPESDARFLAALRDKGAPETIIAKATHDETARAAVSRSGRWPNPGGRHRASSVSPRPFSKRFRLWCSRRF